MLLLKIDKNLDKQQSDKSDNEQEEHKDEDESSQQALLSDKGIVDNSQLILLTKCFLQNGLQKLKLLFPMIIISLLLL